MADDQSAEPEPAALALFRHDLAITLIETLRHQAQCLAEQGIEGKQFEKSVADGIMATAKAAEKLAELFSIAGVTANRGEINDIADLSAFFNAAEEQIDKRARERVAALVAETSIATCPACGASIRASGPA